MAENHRECVLVTGAAGTVGRRVVRELLSSGYTVIAVDRPASPYPAPEPDQEMIVRSGDLEDPGFCEEAVEGAQYVIHAAALIDISRPYDEMAPVNVHAVRHLFEAARRRQVKVFVHFSTGSNYKAQEVEKEGVLDESAPLEAYNEYERTKIESEQVLTDLARSGGPAYVILRPSLIYGQGGRFLGAMLAGLPAFVWLLAGGRMVGFKGGPRSNWCHAEDAARAAVFAMENKRAWNKVLNVADDTPLTFGEVASAAMGAYGEPMEGNLYIPPKWLLKLFIPFLDTDLFFRMVNVPIAMVWGLVRRRYGLIDALQPKLDRATLYYAALDMVFSNARIKGLGFKLKWPDLREGFPGVLEWYMEKGWVPTADQLRDWPELGLGLKFRLNMDGTHIPTDDSGISRPGTLNLEVTLPSIMDVSGWDKLRAEGSCHLEGLADHVSCKGHMQVALQRGDLFYNLAFKSNKQKPLHLQGTTRFETKQPAESISTMNALVYDGSGREVSRATFKVDLPTEVLSVLGSMRIQV